jgi:hypothetical protein
MLLRKHFFLNLAISETGYLIDKTRQLPCVNVQMVSEMKQLSLFYCLFVLVTAVLL